MSLKKSFLLNAQDSDCAVYVLMSALEREICRLQEERAIFENRLKNLEARYCFDPSEMQYRLNSGLLDDQNPAAQLWFDEFSLQQSAQRDLEEAESLYYQLCRISKQLKD
ncbi:MAG: hypothetical protein ACFFB3_04145 [Candidatus Hodarchaeota archaeon]